MYFHCRLAGLALGQIELGHQLAEPLERNRIAVVVVILDDLLLILRVILVPWSNSQRDSRLTP